MIFVAYILSHFPPLSKSKSSFLLSLLTVFSFFEANSLRPTSLVLARAPLGLS